MTAASVSQVRGWDPGRLTAVAQDIATINAVFDDNIMSVARATDETLSHWEGDAAAAAAARALAEKLAGSHLVAAVDACSQAFGSAARELEAARQSALEVVEAATASGFTVLDDGTVRAPVTFTGDIVIDLLVQSKFDEQAQGIEDRLRPLLAEAAETDAACSAKLQNAVDAVQEVQASAGAEWPYSAQVKAIIDGDASLPNEPATLAEFWNGLTPAEKDGLAAWDPNIGNRDGLPAIDKSRYNSQLLEGLTVDARAGLDAVESRHPDWMRDENLPREMTVDELRDYSSWLDDRESAERVLAGYENVRAQLGREDTFLLNIDDMGRGAIALNNPDTAQNVATYIPGTSTVLASIGNDMIRAENLLESANMVSRGPNSVVAWHGYTAPPTMVDAVAEKYADAGAHRLDRFQDGLRAAHEGSPAHTTVIGHSYGSTVIGHAMRDGSSLAVDDVIFAGSPGVGVMKADELNFSGGAGHVYATAAEDDPIMWTDVHGYDPTTKYFGATVIEDAVVATDFDYTPSYGTYFERGNPSLDTIGRIIAGRGTRG